MNENDTKKVKDSDVDKAIDRLARKLKIAKMNENSNDDTDSFVSAENMALEEDFENDNIIGIVLDAPNENNLVNQLRPRKENYETNRGVEKACKHLSV